MPKFSAIVLLTRPKAASLRFAETLANGFPDKFDIITSPLLHIAPTQGRATPKSYAGIIFSSAQAIAFSGAPQDVPVYCVGAETRKRAVAAGWSAVLDAQDADHLYAALVERKIASPVLHMAGEHRRGRLADRLTKAGIETDEMILYTQDALRLSGEARTALEGQIPVIVPLFSPRTAQIFAEQHSGDAPLYIVAISDAALEPVAHLAAAETFVAATPSALAIKHEIAHALRRVEARESPL